MSRAVGDRPKGGPLAARAAILCGEPEFRTYLETRRNLPARTAAQARAAVCRICGVPGAPLESRALIDHDGDARIRFGDLRADLAAWRRGL